MADKAGIEVQRLTKVAEKLFVLYGKGVRFCVNEAGNLAVEYTTEYRLTRQDQTFLKTHAERILFLLPFWRVKLFHSLVTAQDADFLRSCNVNLDFSENSELRAPVVLPSFETTE